jgi:gliding motility-associated-like protein
MALWPFKIPPNNNNGDPVSLGCSDSKTKCENPLGSQIPGYREWWYYYDFEAPSKCDFWTFSVSINARNPSQNIGGGNLYIETTLNNAYAQGNFSPYFSIKPVPYACQNKPFNYNNGAVDPDGDSLVSEIVQPLTGATCGPGTGLAFATKTPALNLTNNPFQTGQTFNINNASGQLTFTPTEIGAQTITIRTREYRNGILIGSIMRDVQIQVIDPSICPPTQAAPNPIVNITNGQYNSAAQRIEGCIGQPLNFCINVSIRDPQGAIIVEGTVLDLLPGSTFNVIGQKTNSVDACVTWTPPTEGNYSFSLLVKDSTCKPPGILFTQVYTYNMFIWGATRAFKDSTICPGIPVQLNALGGGNYLWSVLSGDATLSCTNCTSPIGSINNTSVLEVVSQANGFCPNNRAQITLTRKPIPIYTPIPDDTTCPGSPMLLDLKPKPGVTYNVKWTPATYLDNANIPAPTTNPFNDTRYIAEIRSAESECTVYDTVDIDVLDGFAILTGDTSVCQGTSFQVNAIGDSRYTYIWEPATSVSDPSILNPLINQIKFGEETYTLTAKYASVNQAFLGKGCRDSVATITVNVEPIPTVFAGDDQIICFGDTMTLNGTYTPDNFPYLLSWTPGTALDKDNVANPVFTAQTTSTLTFTATSPKAQCKASDEIRLEVIKPEFLFVSPDTAICPGQSAQLRLTGPTIRTFTWGPDIAINDINSDNPIVSPIATQVYTVYGRDTNSCYDTQMVKVTVKPAAIVDLPGKVTIYPGQEYRMAPQGNALYYSWFPPVGLSRADISDPVVTTDVNTRYIVTGRTEAGCEAMDTVDVVVMPDSKLDMPNAFVPGLNSTLKVLNLGDARLKTFAIYNRWGVKMFETNNINEGWDGRYNGEAQPMGVYVYTIEATTAAGKNFVKQGNITLIR